MSRTRCTQSADPVWENREATQFVPNFTLIDVQGNRREEHILHKEGAEPCTLGAHEQ